MTWHPDVPTLDRYRARDLGAASVMSVEAHLMACANCRQELATRADHHALERIWHDVVDVVDQPQARPAERLLNRLQVPEPAARVIASTPTMQPSWIGAIGATLLFAVVASHVFGGGNGPFLVLAPLVPVGVVAASFGRAADPVWELATASPMGVFRLTMLRAVAVLGVAMSLAAAASVILPQRGWVAAAWLLPACALVLASLLLSAYVSTPVAAAVVGTTWVGIVAVVDRVATAPTAAFGPTGQLVAAATAAVLAAALIVERDTFERHPPVLRSTR